MAREKPLVVSTRVRKSERAQLRAIAELEGVTVSEAIHRLLIPAARARLVEHGAGEPQTS